MKDRIKCVMQGYVDSAGQFEWPKNPEERNSLASRLLGACVVSAMDFWLKKGNDELQAACDEKALGRAKEILGEVARGIVHSMLLRLDQFPNGELELVVRGLESDDVLACINDGDVYDLHDRMWNWIEEFSDFNDQIAKRPSGYQDEPPRHEHQGEKEH